MTSPAPFDAVKALLDGPVAYHPALARVAGGVAGGVFLSQLCYWARTMDRRAKEQDRDPAGLRSVEFWKALPEWRDETGLSVKELRSARERLETSGVLTTRVDRAKNLVYWRVDYGRLAAELSEGEHLPKGQVMESPTLAERATAVAERASHNSGCSETTAETTNNGTGAALGLPPSQNLGARARGAVVAPPDGDDDPTPTPPRGGRPVASSERQDRIQAGGYPCPATSARCAEPKSLPTSTLARTRASSSARTAEHCSRPTPKETSSRLESSAPAQSVAGTTSLLRSVDNPGLGARLSASTAEAGSGCRSNTANIALMDRLSPRAECSSASTGRLSNNLLAEILQPYPQLVQASEASGVPLGLVAQAVLEGRNGVEVLATLRCARAKRARLRSPAAFFRAWVLCRPLGAAPREPRLVDWTEAKRLLVGAGLPIERRARAAVRAIGAALRDGQGRRPLDAWREAAQARAAVEAQRHARIREQIERQLPQLHGELRRRAEAALRRTA